MRKQAGEIRKALFMNRALLDETDASEGKPQFSASAGKPSDELTNSPTIKRKKAGDCNRLADLPLRASSGRRLRCFGRRSCAVAVVAAGPFAGTSRKNA